jgi:hypothetical protein
MSSGREVSIAERSYSFEQQTPTCLDRVAIRAEGRNLACSASGEHYRRHWHGTTVAKGDAAGQARRCLEIIQSAIEGLGGKLSDVTRTRISADPNRGLGKGRDSPRRVLWQHPPREHNH